MRNELITKEKLLVCRSGGRTSEYMFKRLLSEFSHKYEIVGVFANTGWEHPKTLEFVHKNDLENHQLYNASSAWVEARVMKGRAASQHQLVTYKTASRNMEPFKAVAAKYGVPNKAYPHCTRELKNNPIHSYVRTVLGWRPGDYMTALGIRSDEPNRIRRTKDAQARVYPLVDWFQDRPDKLDILDWWEGHSFDLGLPEHLGNCVGCFRKSDRKALKAYRDAPEEFTTDIEREFGFVGPNRIHGALSETPRTMYRNYKTNADLIQMFHEADPGWLAQDDPEHLNEGCASSCEPFLDDLGLDGEEDLGL